MDNTSETPKLFSKLSEILENNKSLVFKGTKMFDSLYSWIFSGSHHGGGEFLVEKKDKLWERVKDFPRRLRGGIALFIFLTLPVSKLI